MQHDDFLTRYMDYAADEFCPRDFHYWTGLSLLAAALENKVYFMPTPHWKLYPNIYVLLLADPGIGKSTAGNMGIKLLKQVINKHGTPSVKLLPEQVTEAQLVKIMEEVKVFDPKDVGKKGPLLLHSPGFWWASEASDTLKSIYGDFVTCLTSWYDCPDKWHRAVKAEGGGVPIPNVTMSLLAGCTFDFLAELIPRKNIGGGFASRLLYVIPDPNWKRKPQFGDAGGDQEEHRKKRQEKELWLVDYLNKVHRLYGGMRCDDSWVQGANELFERNEAERVSTQSQDRRNFLARKHTNAFKLSMLLCVSEGLDMVIKGKHLAQAVVLVDHLEKQLNRIMSVSRQGDSEQSQVTGKIFEAFEAAGRNADGTYKPIPVKELKNSLLHSCRANTRTIQETFNYMYTNDILKLRPNGDCVLVRDAHGNRASV